MDVTPTQSNYQSKLSVRCLSLSRSGNFLIFPWIRDVFVLDFVFQNKIKFFSSNDCLWVSLFDSHSSNRSLCFSLSLSLSRALGVLFLETDKKTTKKKVFYCAKNVKTILWSSEKCLAVNNVRNIDAVSVISVSWKGGKHHSHNRTNKKTHTEFRSPSSMTERLHGLEVLSV